MPAPDYATELARLRAILDAGASSVTTDGTTVSYDLDAVRARIAELESLADPAATAAARPRAASIYLGGW